MLHNQTFKVFSAWTEFVAKQKKTKVCNIKEETLNCNNLKCTNRHLPRFLDSDCTNTLIRTKFFRQYSIVLCFSQTQKDWLLPLNNFANFRAEILCENQVN